MSGVQVYLGFTLLGVIIFIGYLGVKMFDKTKVPDILLLVFIGLLLGPIDAMIFGTPLISASSLGTIAPYFTTLALLMILFEGGLNLNFATVLRKLKIAIIHSTIIFVATVLAVTLIAFVILGYPFVVGLLLGTIIGGISGAVVITVVKGMNISEETRTLLVLESVLVDVLSIILAISLIDIIAHGSENTGIVGVIGYLVSAFLIALLGGALGGFMWLRLNTKFQGMRFSFIITLGAMFLLYGIVEALRGSGPMAVLIFGVVLSNRHDIGAMFRVEEPLVFSEQVKEVHEEITFLIRTYFFVYLGAVFSLQLTNLNVTSLIPALGNLNNTFTLVLIGVVLMFIAIQLIRYMGSIVTVKLHPESEADKGAIWSMSARGLAQAVLASLPFTVAYFDPTINIDYHTLMAPFQAQFLNITFMIIVMTVASTTMAVIYYERKKGQVECPEPVEPVFLKESHPVTARSFTPEDVFTAPKRSLVKTPEQQWEKNNKSIMEKEFMRDERHKKR